MSPSGIQRFDQCGKGQFKGKLEPEDIMLSEAMAISAAALSKHMGKYEESIEGLTRLHTISKETIIYMKCKHNITNTI